MFAYKYITIELFLEKTCLMKKNLPSIVALPLLVWGLFTTTSCREKVVNNNPTPTPEQPQGPYWTTIPALPVPLECSLADIEAAEKKAGSKEHKKVSTAGYTLLEYKTNEKDLPLRTYLIKEESNKLFSGALIYTVDDKVWRAKEELTPEFVKVFTDQGYQLRVDVDANAEKNFSFFRPVEHSVFGYIICTIVREGANNRYTQEPNTQLSFSYGDVIAN